MAALFDLVQDYENADQEGKRTFKDFAMEDIDTVFFNGEEHADEHNVDGKDVLVVLEEYGIKDHSAHWEAGAKQNFDTGLYTRKATLYIKVADYGPKPKQDKRIVIDRKRTYSIKKCTEERGVYRMTLERTRQG